MTTTFTHARRCAATYGAMGLVLLAAPAHAVNIQYYPGQFFRDTNTANPFNFIPDSLVISAGVTPNPFSNPGVLGNATTVHALQDSFDLTLFKINSTAPAFINTYIVETPYNSTLTDAWTIRIENPLSDNLVVEVQTQAIGAVAPVPFATNMRLTGTGTTLQLDWTLDDISRIDSYGMTIWDMSLGKVVHFVGDLGTVATSMSKQIPVSFNNGVDSLTLGHQYAFSLEATDRVSGSGTPNLANSSSFFVFTPQATALNAYLPSVGTDDVYHFDLDITAPDQIVFIDPEVAIGYDFAIGAGNPNFASVLLPQVGDGSFKLWLFDESDVAYDSGETLFAGVEHDFATGGLERFRILGIETSAMLDPSDTTAFQAGLTFTATGSFTGTMTPITAPVVPLPPALALIGGPLLLMLRLRRRAAVDDRRSHRGS